MSKQKHRFVIERHLEIYFEVIDRTDNSLVARYNMGVDGSQKEAYKKAKILKDKMETSNEETISIAKETDVFAVTNYAIRKQRKKKAYLEGEIKLKPKEKSR